MLLHGGPGRFLCENVPSRGLAALTTRMGRRRQHGPCAGGLGSSGTAFHTHSGLFALTFYPEPGPRCPAHDKLVVVFQEKKNIAEARAKRENRWSSEDF